MEFGSAGLLIGWAGCLRNVHDSARMPLPLTEAGLIAAGIVLRETATAWTGG